MPQPLSLQVLESLQRVTDAALAYLTEDELLDELLQRVADILTREVTRTMQLLGVASVAELTPERVRLRA